MTEYFVNIFEFNKWANLKIFDGILNNKSFLKDSLKIFSHILIAEKTWIDRIKGISKVDNNFWPQLHEDELEKLIYGNTKEYLELIKESNDQHFKKEIKYNNSKGVEFNTVLKDILSHVGAHGSYHRGQINISLREGGIEPLNVDFITFARLSKTK